MSTLQAAALVCPVLLVVLGLVIGRVVRSLDRTGDPAVPAIPVEEVLPAERGTVFAEPGGVPEAVEDDHGPDAADARELRVRR